MNGEEAARFIKFLLPQLKLSGLESKEDLIAIALKYDLGYAEAPVLHGKDHPGDANRLKGELTKAELQNLVNTQSANIIGKPFFLGHQMSDKNTHGFIARHHIDTDGRLHLGAFIFKNQPKTEKIYNKIISGELHSFSIGFTLNPNNSCRVNEVSATANPALPNTEITFCFSNDMEEIPTPTPAPTSTTTTSSSSAPAPTPTPTLNLTPPSAAAAAAQEPLKSFMDLFKTNPDEVGKQVANHDAELKKREQEIATLRQQFEEANGRASMTEQERQELTELKEARALHLKELEVRKQKELEEYVEKQKPEFEELVKAGIEFGTIQVERDEETGGWKPNPQIEALRKLALDPSDESRIIFDTLVKPLKDQLKKAIADRSQTENFQKATLAAATQREMLQQQQQRINEPRKRSAPTSTPAPAQTPSSSLTPPPPAKRQQYPMDGPPPPFWSMFSTPSPLTTSSSSPFSNNFEQQQLSAPLLVQNSNDPCESDFNMADFEPGGINYCGEFAGSSDSPVAFLRQTTPLKLPEQNGRTFQFSLDPKTSVEGEEAMKALTTIVRPHLFSEYDENAGVPVYTPSDPDGTGSARLSDYSQSPLIKASADPLGWWQNRFPLAYGRPSPHIPRDQHGKITSAIDYRSDKSRPRPINPKHHQEAMALLSEMGITPPSPFALTT